MITPSEALEPVLALIAPLLYADGTEADVSESRAAVVALVVAELEAMIGGHVSGCPCSICQRLAAWRALA